MCDVSVNTLTLEVTGKEDKMLALKEVLEPYGEPRQQAGGVGNAACWPLRGRMRGSCALPALPRHALPAAPASKLPRF